MVSKQTPGMSGSRRSKEERRAEAREKARLLREQQEKRAKRNRLLVILGAILALAVVALAIVKIVSTGTDELGGYEGQARSAELKNVGDDLGIAIGANGEAAAERFADVPQVQIYSDFMCIYCTQLDNAASEAYLAHAAAKDVQVIHYPVAILGQEFGQLGAAAAFYVATYAPDKFEDFHRALFERSTKILIDRNAAQPNAGEIADIAKSVGISEDVVNDLPASITSEAWTKVVEDANIKFRDAGFAGTPTVLVDGTEDSSWGTLGMPALLDSLAAKNK
ncbi:MAG: DsbA family protein [Arcanobacterium sp.]|nr:DsbA family protein [Arcanobacterium sp.]